MAEFKLPELGENVTGGDVVGILVSVGDTVTVDQDIVELETDKATVTVPTSVAGVIQTIHIAEGDHVEVGQVILTIGETATASNGQPSAPSPVAESAPPVESSPPPVSNATSSGPAEFKLPELGENITGGDVVGVLIAVGDTITTDQDVLELETDKATVTVPSSVAGTVTAISVAEGDHVEIGQVILTVTTADSPTTVQASQPTTMETTAPPKQAASASATSDEPMNVPPKAGAPLVEIDPNRVAVLAAPNVRRLARELGIDITMVPSSGSGRITISDLKDYSRSLNQVPPQPSATPSDSTTSTTPASTSPASVATVVSKPLPDFSKWGEIETEKMSNIRRATANQMAYAWSSAPRVTQFDKAYIDELEVIRKKYSPRLQKSGTKLTVTAILLKVMASALKQFPKFNASIDVENNQVIFKKYYHIGVAVDTPNGLLVPVIRDVDRKNIFELAVELNEVAAKARERKLGLEEMQGGTFTISNLGGIGGTNFTPIVNAPEVAILGVARGAIEPTFNPETETFEPRRTMPLAVSYDHRLIDGAEGARFLRWICEALEDPMTMSLQAW